MPAFDITEKRPSINIFLLDGANVNQLSKNDIEIFDIGKAFQKLNRIREQKNKEINNIYSHLYGRTEKRWRRCKSMLINHNKIEKRLWEAANQLWAKSKLTPSDCCMPVLGLVFLRHAANCFEMSQNGLERSNPNTCILQVRGDLGANL